MKSTKTVICSVIVLLIDGIKYRDPTLRTTGSKLDGESLFVGLLTQKVTRQFCIFFLVFQKHKLRTCYHWRTILCHTPEISTKFVCFVIKQKLFPGQFLVISLFPSYPGKVKTYQTSQVTKKPRVNHFFWPFD